MQVNEIGKKAGKRLNATPVKLSFLDEGMH
jgi:hypothetical protein